MYYIDEEGRRVYTLKKTDVNNEPTNSAHPGKYHNFSMKHNNT